SGFVKGVSSGERLVWYSVLGVGYFAGLWDARLRARLAGSANPFSAVSMACSRSFSKLIVAERSSRMYQASTVPGMDPERRPSLVGILPPLFLLYHSMVASFGAGASALMEYGCLVFAS